MEAGPARVPPRRAKASGQKARGLAINAIWNLQATRPNHIWSYDFMGSRLRNGTGLRILNVVDEFTREGLASRVDRSIGTRDVQEELERLFRERGKAEILRSDNGREFISSTLVDWLTELGVTVAFIERAAPSRTRSWSGSTGPCATRSSTARSSKRCWRRASSSMTGAGATTRSDRIGG